MKRRQDRSLQVFSGVTMNTQCWLLSPATPQRVFLSGLILETMS